MPAILGNDDRPLAFVAAERVCNAAHAYLLAVDARRLDTAADLRRLRVVYTEYRETIEANARYVGPKPKRTKKPPPLAAIDG